MPIEKWRKLDSEYELETKWITVRKDKCELPNGTVKDDYYVIEYPDWANAVALTADGKIILVRQYRYAGDMDSLELPGGVVDAGETPEQAIRRELLEETGYSFDSCEHVVSLNPNPATNTNTIHTYLLKGGTKTQEQKLDEHEIVTVETYTIAEVKQLLKEHKMGHALHVAGLYCGLEKL